MKKIIFVLSLAILPFIGYSQQLFIGAGMGPTSKDYAVALIYTKQASIATLDVSVAYDFDEFFLQLKMPIRVFQQDRITLNLIPPFMNMNLSQGGKYNTPIGVSGVFTGKDVVTALEVDFYRSSFTFNVKVAYDIGQHFVKKKTPKGKKKRKKRRRR